MKTPEPPANPSYETDTPAPLCKLIAGQPFFKGLAPGHLRLLAEAATRTHFEPGQHLFQKGDPANRFYLVLRGKVTVETCDENGCVHRIQEVGPGGVAGWSWLFPPYYWHFDAVAAEATEVIFFYGTRLRAECQKNSEFGYELMKRVAEVVIARLQASGRQLLKDT